MITLHYPPSDSRTDKGTEEKHDECKEHSYLQHPSQDGSGEHSRRDASGLNGEIFLGNISTLAQEKQGAAVPSRSYGSQSGLPQEACLGIGLQRASDLWQGEREGRSGDVNRGRRRRRRRRRQGLLLALGDATLRTTLTWLSASHVRESPFVLLSSGSNPPGMAAQYHDLARACCSIRLQCQADIRQVQRRRGHANDPR
jgi:hypothetical protein